MGTKPIDPQLYISLMESLIYIINTWPDVCYAVSLVNRFMNEPDGAHLQGTRQILRYLRGTIDFGLHLLSWGEEGLCSLQMPTRGGTPTPKDHYLASCTNLKNLQFIGHQNCNHASSCQQPRQSTMFSLTHQKKFSIYDTYLKKLDWAQIEPPPYLVTTNPVSNL
jgi:hypothetical protein